MSEPTERLTDSAARIGSIFDGMEKSDAAILRNYGQMLSFAEGEHIVRKGEKDDSVYFIERGIAQVIIQHPGLLFAKKSYLEIGAGHVFGEMAFLDNKPRSATVTAKNDVTVLKYTRETIEMIYQSYPRIAQQLVMWFGRVVSERRR